MTSYFAVYEWRDGKHDGYIDHSQVNAPLMSEHAVGYAGFSTMRGALDSLRRHREMPCDGHCEPFLARKRKGAEAFERERREGEL